MAYSFDKYLTEDEGYMIPSGMGTFVSHDTPEDVLSSQLDFCGCGLPEEAFRYIHGHLQRIADRWADKISAEQVESAFHSQGEFYFLMYFLDAKGFTEHGGSVGGSWLTDKGQVLLSDLNMFLTTKRENQ